MLHAAPTLVAIKQVSRVWIMVGVRQGRALCLRVDGASCLCGIAGIEQTVRDCGDACGGHYEDMGIGEWTPAGGCSVGWKERCSENVLIAPVCRGQT